jgi:hypothetical protein
MIKAGQIPPPQYSFERGTAKGPLTVRRFPRLAAKNITPALNLDRYHPQGLSMGTLPENPGLATIKTFLRYSG